MLASLAFVVLSRQVAERPVTVELPAMPLARSLGELSKRVGTTLRCAPSMVADVVVIRTEDVPLKDLMDRIAEATLGEWHQKDSDWVLSTSSAAERKQRAAWLADRTAIIRAGLATLQDSPEYRATWTPALARELAETTERVMHPQDGRLSTEDKPVQALFPRSPGSRALVGILLALGPELLAEATADGRAVFSTQPNRLQRPLPAAAQGAIRRYFEEHKEFVQATKDYLATQPVSQNSFQVSGISRGEWSKGNPNLGLGKAIVSVASDPRRGSLTASVILTDPNGIELTNAFRSVNLEVPLPKTLPAAADEAKVEVGPLEKEIEASNRMPSSRSGDRTIMRSNGKGMKKLVIPPPMPARTTAIDAGVLSELLHPDTNEPLGLAGRGLLAAAQSRKLNLVALLQDDAYIPSVAHFARGGTATAFVGSSSFQRDHEVNLNGKWLEVHPRNTLLARYQRTNRSALANLLQSVSRRKLLTLDDLARFALSQNRAMGEGFPDFAYLRTLNPAAANGTYQPREWYTYRFFGTLSGEQRQFLGNGGALVFGNLSSTAQDAIRRLVFNSTSQPKLTRADGTEIQPWNEGIVQDWTELLPSGVLGAASVRAAISREEAAYAANSGTGSAQIVGPLTLAAQRFITQSPGLRTGPSAPFDKYIPATLWTYEFSFSLAPGIAVQRTLTDGTFDEHASPVAYDALPTTFRNRLAAEMQELQEFFGDMDFSGRGTGTPPPQ